MVDALKPSAVRQRAYNQQISASCLDSLRTNLKRDQEGCVVETPNAGGD